MTTYTAIADSEIDPESPGTTTLFTKLRDNPIAITEGATGAPRISPGAFTGSFGLFYLGSGDDGSKTVSSSENLSSGEYHYTDLTINASQTLGVTESTDGFLLLRVTGDVILSGAINLIGKGASGGASQSTASTDGNTGGIGSGGGTGGGGGSSDSTDIGGAGGVSTIRNESVSGGAQSANGPNAAGGAGNTPSADIQKIIRAQTGLELYKINGSGGGSGGYRTGTPSGAGGNGGGGVIIIADTITLNSGSSIDCSGGSGGAGTDGINGSGGGGGGGVVILAARTITNNGTITVSGGSPGADSGNGGVGGTGGAGYSELITLG